MPEWAFFVFYPVFYDIIFAMKWKNLYNVSHKFKWPCVVLLAINMWYTGESVLRSRPDGANVSVNYAPYSGGGTGAYYNPFKDEITIFYNTPSNKDDIYALVHELKHAKNAQEFSYFLTINAEELSAYFAGELYDEGFMQQFQRALQARDSVAKQIPLSDWFSAMDSLRLARGKLDYEYNTDVKELRAEKQHLIDSIVLRFKGAEKDSLVRAVENKYSEVSIADKKLEKWTKVIDDIRDKGLQMSPVVERDFNYSVPDLNQEKIDTIFLHAMDIWSGYRNNAYLTRRLATALNTQLHPLNDAELEKLFTYKINGVHRSLFKEASPEIQAKVRRMVNRDNLVFMAKRALGRE